MAENVHLQLANMQLANMDMDMEPPSPAARHRAQSNGRALLYQ